MDKIRKIGVWLWYAKERMVLVVVVGLLCWQMYNVANPKPLDQIQPIAPPRPEPTDDWEGPPPPPPLPPRVGPEDWSGLWTRHLFWVYGGFERSNTPNDGEQDPGIRLLKIMVMPDGAVLARLQTNAVKWYRAGDKFESFELLSIDPDAQTCEVFSEKLAQPITLHISAP